MTSGYHSVYLPPAGVRPRQRWEGRDGSLAMVHDVLAGPLPDAYEDCDLLYADLPWRAGFPSYNQRAGVDDTRTYRQFLEAVTGVVRAARRPVVLVTGRHALSHLPTPTQILPVTMPVLGQAAVTLLYNLVVADPWTTTTDALERLAGMYRRVGDFCCGYGASANAFVQVGRTFVVSDYNPECVGYVAAHADGWRSTAK